MEFALISLDDMLIWGAKFCFVFIRNWILPSSECSITNPRTCSTPLTICPRPVLVHFTFFGYLPETQVSFLLHICPIVPEPSALLTAVLL